MSSFKRCFVIMPFSATKSHSEDYWKKHFEKFLKPNIEKVQGVKAFRSEPLRGNIANEIIMNLIERSYIVIADLTDFNPNVLWELGVRQSYKNRTITIAESGTSIPFHFSHKGIFSYDANHLEDEPFLIQLTSAIKDCLLYPEKPDSPVLEAMTGRGTLYEIIKRDENKRKVDALQLECQKNKKLIRRIYQIIDKNKKTTPKGNTTLGERLQSSAIQLLLTNRYLDKDTKFYIFFIDLFGLISVINIELNQWQRSQEIAEKWFLGHRTLLESDIKKCEEIIHKLLDEANAKSMFYE